MGLLDDAIREHLDLKRRRGADPSEIERAERDALGPVRREPEPIRPEGYDEPPGDYDEPGYEPEPEFAAEPAHDAREDAPLYDDELDADFDAPPPGALPPEPEPPLPHGTVGTGPSQPIHDEPLDTGPVHDEPLETHEDDPWVSEPGAPTAPPPEPADMEPPATRRDPLPEPEPPPGGNDQETVEYSIHEHEHEPQGEDMLEETPEFLQDTPDHDRLWFEQRPPRDFDWDK